MRIQKYSVSVKIGICSRQSFWPVLSSALIISGAESKLIRPPPYEWERGVEVPVGGGPGFKDVAPVPEASFIRLSAREPGGAKPWIGVGLLDEGVTPSDTPFSKRLNSSVPHYDLQVLVEANAYPHRQSVHPF